MAQVFLAAFGVALCVVVCSGHMCMLNPKQRGSISGLDTTGSNDCGLTTGPCGGRPVQEPSTVYRAGGNYTVIFQKNLDHYTAATPGRFSITLMSSGFSKELASIPDGGETSLHLYNAMISLAGVPKENYILQARYITNNSQAPAAFFQCADVVVA